MRKRMKWLSALLIFTLLYTISLPVLAADREGVVIRQSDGSTAFLLAEPDVSASPLSPIPTDAVVIITDEVGDFYKVNISTQTGYVQKRFIQLTAASSSATAAQQNPAAGGPAARPTADTLYSPVSSEMIELYAAINGTVRDKFYTGTSVMVYSKGVEWSDVSINNIRGFIKTRYLLSSNPGVTNPVNPTLPTRPPTGGNNTVIATAYVYNSISSNKVNLRQWPNENAAVLGQYYSGTEVKVYERGADWCDIQIGTQRGYMMTRYLSFNRPGGGTGGGGGGTGGGGTGGGGGNTGGNSNYTSAVVNNPIPTDRLHLRESPSMYSASLGLYANGTTVRVLEYGATWCYVQVNNLYGYMMTKYLAFGSSGGGTGGGGGGGGSAVRYAYVNNPNPKDRLNLRVYPSISSAILGRYYNGTSVKVLEYGADWCYVEVSGIYGYMQTQFLSFSGSPSTPTPTPAPNPSPAGYAVVNNPDPRDRLNLREAASSTSRSLGRYYNGTQVRVLQYGATWCYVQVNGIAGYMMTRYLSFSGSTTNTAVVNNPIATQVLNLREYPTTGSRSLGQYRNGVVVTVVEYGNTWCRVSVGGITGYMMTAYLKF